MFPIPKAYLQAFRVQKKFFCRRAQACVKEWAVIGLWCLLGKDFHFWIQQKPGDVQQVSLFWNQICDLIQTIWDLQVAIARLLFSSHFCTFFGGQLPRQCGFLCRWYPGSQPEHSSDHDPQWKPWWKVVRIDHGGYFRWSTADERSVYYPIVTVDGSEIRRENQVEVASLSHCLQGLLHAKWFLGFLNHQQ